MKNNVYIFQINLISPDQQAQKITLIREEYPTKAWFRSERMGHTIS